MSVSGVINTHFIVAYMLLQHGTEEQKKKYLPRMAEGEVRGAFSMSEPGCGSDVAAIKTKAVTNGDGYSITGQKMWLTNGGSSNLVAVLVKTDEGADSVYKNMTTFLVEKEVRLRRDRPGGHHPRQDREDGLQGRRHHRDDLRGPPDRRRPDPRRRARQGLLPDDGRRRGRPRQRRGPRGAVSRNRAFELGVAYAQQRETFGKKIAEHQAVLFRLAEMATKVEAAHQMMVKAARTKDKGERNDLEAGMAKYLAVGVLLTGRRGLLPDPRRLRLLQGVRDRAALPRGADAADRRGHGRHPADDHRPPDPRGLQAEVTLCSAERSTKACHARRAVSWRCDPVPYICRRSSSPSGVSLNASR